MKVTDFTVESSSGPVELAQYQGHVMLLVNTASECMFTPQYAGLEQLHQRFADRGLVVLGFPCNQFGEQEPGSNEEVQQFCTRNYAVTFPVMSKIEVNGDNADPLYTWLTGLRPSPAGEPKVDWNFTKFLVSPDGESVQRFEPKEEPESLAPHIEALLAGRESARS